MNIYKISSKALAKRPLLCKLLLKKASRLFSCMALATFWQPANILEFFVFQSSFPNHFQESWSENQNNNINLEPTPAKSKALEIKDILLKLFSSPTHCNCMDLTRKLPKTLKHCHNYIIEMWIIDIQNVQILRFLYDCIKGRKAIKMRKC